MMTNASENPWIHMPESSQRRADIDNPHDIYWITDIRGDYGLSIKTKCEFTSIEKPLNLKGVSILKRNSNARSGELYLVLNKKEDWPIFLLLCRDLINITQKCATDLQAVDIIENRLKRWQQLLKQNSRIELTLERQMGLFSELLCLRDIVAPNCSMEQAISFWVGPDLDKQDFLMDRAVIEVKSHRTSSGPFVYISSLHQLYSDKKPLFLMSYALTQADSGQSVEELAQHITAIIGSLPDEIRVLFEDKLIDYGYAPEFNSEPLYKFIVDKCSAFRVSDKFPKILPKDINSRIKSVKYTIDLSQCREYEVEISTMFNEGTSHD